MKSYKIENHIRYIVCNLYADDFPHHMWESLYYDIVHSNYGAQGEDHIMSELCRRYI